MWRSILKKSRAVFLERCDRIYVVWVLLVIYDRPSMLTNSDVSYDARSAICCGQMAKFSWKGIFSYINCRSIKENNESLLCSMSYIKVISYDYFVILQCQTVSLCRSLYDYQTHILLRPNGWLGSFERIYSLLFCWQGSIERKYCFLLCGEAFFWKITSRFGEGDFQYIHVIWDLLVIYDRTSMLTNIDVSCNARCANCCGQTAD